MTFPRNLQALLALALFTSPALAATNPISSANIGESEALKCEEKIATVQRDVLGKYEDALADLQGTLQKAADLEGALAVRAERQRLAQEHTLSERNYVPEPKSLRQLQMQEVGKMQELVGQIMQDTLPKLVELKKAMTVAGKLDDAVAVRTVIEKLQNSYVPISRADPGSIVPAETLLLAYTGDRMRADKTYKGQRITVHGAVGGYRQDPADAKFYDIYLSGGNSGMWVQCAFSTNDYRFREDKAAFGASSLVIMQKNGDILARLQKGQSLDIRGVCEGLDEVVRLDRCDIPR